MLVVRAIYALPGQWQLFFGQKCFNIFLVQYIMLFEINPPPQTFPDTNL